MVHRYKHALSLSFARGDPMKPVEIVHKEAATPALLHPDVMQVERHDYVDLAPTNRARAQPMQGFDEIYTDIVDYIVRCTHRIWDERDVGLIYSHYTHNCVLYTPAARSIRARKSCATPSSVWWPCQNGAAWQRKLSGRAMKTKDFIPRIWSQAPDGIRRMAIWAIQPGGCLLHAPSPTV